MYVSTNEACRAVKAVAWEKGVAIEPRALVPDFTNDPRGILEASYHALMEYSLNAKEREIANKLCGDLETESFPTLTYWAVKLAAVVDEAHPRAADLYWALCNCLLCSPPEDSRRLEDKYMDSIIECASNALQAAKIAASIQGAEIDDRTLVPGKTIVPHNVLKAAYHALATEVQAPSL